MIPQLFTLVIAMLASFLLGAVAMTWVGWELIKSLVRQDCEQRGYDQAVMDGRALSVRDQEPCP